jgi:hypothetical protein
MARRRGQAVTDTMTDATAASGDGANSPGVLTDVEVGRQLMERARAEGVKLVGPGGLLAELTKTVIETALEAEMTDHVGCEPYDPAGHHSGNSRNGTHTKTVLTAIGPIDVDVPRDPRTEAGPQTPTPPERPLPPSRPSPRALPQRASRLEVPLPHHRVLGPHRAGPATVDQPWKPALNAFHIAFEGRIIRKAK